MLYPKNVADILRNLCAKIEKIHKLEQIEYTDKKNSTIPRYFFGETITQKQGLPDLLT